MMREQWVIGLMSYILLAGSAWQDYWHRKIRKKLFVFQLPIIIYMCMVSDEKPVAIFFAVSYIVLLQIDGEATGNLGIGKGDLLFLNVIWIWTGLVRGIVLFISSLFLVVAVNGMIWLVRKKHYRIGSRTVPLTVYMFSLLSAYIIHMQVDFK